MENLIKDPEDGLLRCGWCGRDEIYKKYHDEEWGTEALDDRSQFEFVVLESAQAGLSWLTVLRKREAYRKAYAGFNPEIVAGWGEEEINRMMNNSGIVRNRRKIEASINNAGIFLELSGRYGSFANWLLTFYNDKTRINHWDTLEKIPVTSPEAELIAREARLMGFKFFGPIITYSHLQATGIVNDHLSGCWKRQFEEGERNMVDMNGRILKWDEVRKDKAKGIFISTGKSQN